MATFCDEDDPLLVDGLPLSATAAAAAADDDDVVLVLSAGIAND